MSLKKNCGAHKRSQTGNGIRTRLVLGLTVFVIIVLIIVWIFQVLLLDFFYEKNKISELRTVQAAIDDGKNSADFDDICAKLASDYDVCIAIYSVNDNALGDLVVSKEVSPSCIIHYADKSYLESLYNQASEAGGTFMQPFSLGPGEYSGVKKDNHKKEPEPNNTVKKENVLRSEEKFIIAVSAKIFEKEPNDKYVAFINLKFTPVNTIQTTRNMQFAYISVVVIVASVAFALIFSMGIARPLEKMTRSAERMACGDYSAEFAVEGYRETQRLAKTLNYAIEEISKTDKLQRELIANVSHDLRTPLTLISGYAEMMRDLPGENNPENSQLIVDEAKRLTELVNDILDFSKYSSGTEKPSPVYFNLTEKVTRVIERYSELIKHHGYNIVYSADQNVCVYADERMILQVLYNLISNAINYTGKDKTVQIAQLVMPDNTVKISISDSGAGIPESDLEHIWDRYYKVDKSHSRAVAGSGLGLSIVRKLLQLHGASYGVESSSSRGTTFWFTLKISNE